MKIKAAVVLFWIISSAGFYVGGRFSPRAEWEIVDSIDVMTEDELKSLVASSELGGIISNKLGLSCFKINPIASGKFKDAINIYRASKGLSALKETGLMNSTARSQWEKINTDNNNDAFHPGGLPPGYGEILGTTSAQSAEELLDQYKLSQSHNALILSEEYTEMGSYVRDGVHISVFR